MSQGSEFDMGSTARRIARAADVDLMVISAQ